MALFLILGLLLIGSSFLSIIFNKKIEKVIPIWIFMIIVTLYIFGLFNKLKYGVFFIEILSISSTGYLLYDLIKRKKVKKYKELLFTKGLIIFLFLFGVLCIMHHGRYLSGWDEFSHWGDVVKAMFDINDFSTSPLSMSTFKSYPPGMSLFQYFWVKAAGSFNESYLYISYQLFMFSLFIPFITNLKGKFNTILGIFLIFLLPIIFYPTYYQTIYIDAAVGILFSYIVLSIYFNEKEDIFDKLNICLGLFTLVLLKDVGLFFGIIAIIIYLVKNIQLANIKKFIKINKKYIITIVIMILSLLTAKLTWNYEIVSNHVTAAFSQAIDFRQLLNIITLRDSSYRVEVFKNFINALSEKDIFSGIIKLPFLKVLVLLFVGYYYVIGRSTNKKNIKKISLALLVSLLVYIFGIITMYCFKFSQYEALNLASYERYINIYMIAIITVLIFEMMNKVYIKQLITIAIVIFLLLPNNIFNSIYASKVTAVARRESYSNNILQIKEQLPKGSKIYVIVQNTSGFDYWNLRYLFRPIKINNGGWSIGEKYNDKDIWTVSYKSGNFIDKLIKEEYNYLYLYKIDELFIKQFKEIFADSKVEENRLYSLDKETRKLKLLK